MVKSTLEFIMLMCVHLSAQDTGIRDPGGGVGAREGDMCASTDSRTSVLSGCLLNWLVGSATRFDP